MQPNFPSRKLYAFGRRGAVGLIAAASAVGFVGKSRAASNRIIDITSVGADPTGVSDSSAAIQAAGDTLLGLKGGELFIPPGEYLLANPISWSTANGPISIIGVGSSLSVLHVMHTGTAISYTSTSQGDGFLVRDIGFSPTPVGGGAAGTALAAAFPGTKNSPPPYSTLGQPFEVQNVDFGSIRFGYTWFANAIVLTDASRSQISNCVMHCNPPSQQLGGTFLQLAGECLDARITGCSVLV